MKLMWVLFPCWGEKNDEKKLNETNIIIENRMCDVLKR
jgi:hypothetical protein